jgi:KaiC/GvpD/RAD55 family RecA-like ATPase
MEIRRIKTYIERMDEHLEGGIPAGSIVLVCGTPGTMKSSLCYSLLYHNARQEGIRGVYLTLEQEKKSLLRQMAHLGMGEAERLRVMDLDGLQGDRKGDWIQQVRCQIQRWKEKEDFQLLVIDSLNALYSLSSIEQPRREIYRLFRTLREENLTAYLVSEISLGGEGFGQFGVEEFLADGIIHLDLQKKGDILSSLERYIGVIKMRSTNHDTQYFPLLYLDDRFRIFGREELALE